MREELSVNSDTRSKEEGIDADWRECAGCPRRARRVVKMTRKMRRRHLNKRRGREQCTYYVPQSARSPWTLPLQRLSLGESTGWFQMYVPPGAFPRFARSKGPLPPPRAGSLVILPIGTSQSGDLQLKRPVLYSSKEG
eukprot:760612-Hanusia_phi.AAC.2